MSTAWLVVLTLWGGTEGVPQVRLTLEGCGALRVDELTRQLRLELGEGLSVEQLDAPDAALEVTFRCGRQKWEVEVDDHLTDKRLTRRLPAPTSSLEKYAAVSAAQLIVASWFEFLSSRRVAPETPRAQAALVVAQRDLAPARVESTTPEHPMTVTVEAAAVGRLRQDAGGLAALGPILRIALGWGPAEVGVGAALDFGTYRTTFGTVDARTVAGTVDGAVRVWAPRAWVSLWLQARATVGATRLAGTPLSSVLPAAEVAALHAEAALGAGPRMSYGRWSLRLRFELGTTFAAPRGVVPGGFVQPLGSFVGVALGAACTW